MAKLLSDNPFSVLRNCTVQPSETQTFVTPEVTQRLLDACPDHEWRVIIGLARLAALRCPSEVLALQWQHVNWEHRTLVVPCPKTRRQGRAFRVVPICPELYTILSEAFERAEPGARWVITRYRDREQNLRTQLGRICLQAGVPPFPRPFVAMRSSRVTEWVELFPVQCASEWAGHTPAICQRHYLQTRSEYVQRAIGTPALVGATAGRPTSVASAPDLAGVTDRAPPAAEKTVQFLVQSIAENKDSVHQNITPPSGTHTTLQDIGSPFGMVPNCQLPRTGFEPVTPGLGNRCSIL